MAWIKAHFDFAIFEMGVALVCGAAVGIFMSTWSKIPGEQFDQMPLIYLGIFSMLLTVVNGIMGAGYLVWMFTQSRQTKTQT